MKRISFMHIFFALCVFSIFILFIKYWEALTGSRQIINHPFDNFDNTKGSSKKIIPNLIHYVIFNRDTIDFITYVSIISAIKIQKPIKVFVHSNKNNFGGYYWDKIQNSSNNKLVQIRYLPLPTHVYGQKLSSVYHASDVARIQVLRQWGGIYLDTDTIVLKSLEHFQYFEMVIGWPKDQNIGTQILLAHRNARFLALWLQSYRFYKPSKWYYNAGQLPTQKILSPFPGLVHRVPVLFGVHYLIPELYTDSRWLEWKQYYAIHLLSRHTRVTRNLNETTIKEMNNPFSDIVKWILSL